MKIGILTFHMAHNYGAMLQAYALCEKLNQMDLQCEVIDYRIPAIYNWHRKDNFTSLVSKNGSIIGSLKYIKRILTRYYTKDKRWYNFHKFMVEDIKLSKDTYEDIGELKNLNYDTYICGSDQIWNTEHSGGIKSGYFLDFAPSSSKKIAYAASKGNPKIADEEKEAFKSLLSEFYAIGAREQGLVTSLKEIGLKDAQLVLDPTLLLKKDDWSKIAICRDYKDYILVYKIKDHSELYECARKVSRETGYKIIEISYNRTEGADDIIQLQDCGPREFLGLFSNASYVVTNSFHGTCFSIIFNKKFLSVPYLGLQDRMESLLQLLDLEDRKVKDLENINLNKDIDYDKVNELLNIEREKSIKFLRENLK